MTLAAPAPTVTWEAAPPLSSVRVLPEVTITVE